MRKNIDCFLACRNFDELKTATTQLTTSRTVGKINLLVGGDTKDGCTDAPDGTVIMSVDGVATSKTIREIAERTDADYVMLLTRAVGLNLGLGAAERLARVAADADAAMVYSDYAVTKDGTTTAAPVIDYQTGSLRDDFDFGPLILVKTQLLKLYVAETQDKDYKHAALYDLRLFLSRKGSIFRINECLYTAIEPTPESTGGGEAQFKYVDPANREVQKEMERAVTDHLRAIDALVDTTDYRCPDFGEQDFPVEASVIIPVKNREKTIVDAVKSALSQKTKFDFNVIVVDNHSTDNTTELLRQLAEEANKQPSTLAALASKAPLMPSVRKPQLIHIVPEREDLGIGGCWNLAVGDKRCGRFAVQLDSDDLYSGNSTLQTIVEAFYAQKAAMIVGSYRICDFELNTLPPGLIDHREWTDENGPNNALRINGLGAPRAFFTPLLRQIQLPNTSYGEDYAMGLIFSRRHRIGRIYDELYLCRRWGGNSDSSLSREKQNANNLYKDRLRSLEVMARQRMKKGHDDVMADSTLLRFFNRQLEAWETARVNYRKLHSVEIKELAGNGITLMAQHNPERMRSTGTSIDAKAVADRPCFLCEKNRPQEQMKKVVDENFELLVNPYPILPKHFTIALRRHEKQQIRKNYGVIYSLLTEYPELTVFYNGPKSGASAPDHAHLQAGMGLATPLQQSWMRLCRSLRTLYKMNDEEGISVIDDYPCAAFLIQSRTRESGQQLFYRLYDALPKHQGETEPMMNIVSWKNENEWISVVLPRRKHRPDCYTMEGDGQYLVSPGAIDMAGILILPREEDFIRMTPETAYDILKEVALTDEEMKLVAERLTMRPEEHSDADGKLKEPEVTVGIMTREKICFTLNGTYTAKGESIEGEQNVEFAQGGILWNGNIYRELEFVPQKKDGSFSLHDVTIGVNFHWERNETQTFDGTLRLVVEADKITAINQLPVERYLASVISSEMKDTASPEFLRAHAVISRSWLLAQMEKRKQAGEGGNGFFSTIKKDNEIVRWYDREEHTIFDVCADDHCQRYQGITKSTKKSVIDAIKATRGQILMYDEEICDARFSKCCGGATEEFRYCWENVDKPYLVALKDGRGKLPDLTKEEEVDKWIRTSPDAFCNTKDENVLSQVLQDYDRETQDFYRWKVEYTQDELSALIAEKTKEEFGSIVDLIALERGKSGRICRLKIVGTLKTLIIGKELEIRRTLSSTHLYSSAFIVDKTYKGLPGIPSSFTILGAGWGHGVGLCQIGAAMMGEQGYDYDKILLHYYRGAEIKKIYE